jgi:hypothetical protein
MANHGATKNKIKYAQPPPEERYNSHEVHKQLACYRYWTHLVEGRNSKKLQLLFGIGEALVISKLTSKNLAGKALQK